MVLFFLVTLVAAYTSRNMLFEQRTSSNQYRSTLALETADAGVEWALTRLNGGRMTDACLGTADTTLLSFRDRYLTIDAATGVVTPIADRAAGCVFNGASWDCACTTTATPAPTVTYTGTGPFAAFWVRFVAVNSTKPGLVRIQVNSCTRVADECLNFAREAQSGDGVASVWAMVALRSGVAAAPAAPLTVRGALSQGTGNVTLVNTDPGTGFTLHSTAAAPGWLTLQSVPGSPGLLSAAVDSTLSFPDLALIPAQPANSGNDRMFNSVFGMWPTTFADHPAIVNIDCSAGCAAAADVNPIARLNPGRIIRLTGNGVFTVDEDVGTAAAPVLILMDGSMSFGAGPFTMYGVAYSRAATFQLQGTGSVVGAVVTERDFRAEANAQTLTYDPAVIDLVRRTIGSFAKVPGGWKDIWPCFSTTTMLCE
jgi:hypothetical protein